MGSYGVSEVLDKGSTRLAGFDDLAPRIIRAIKGSGFFTRLDEKKSPFTASLCSGPRRPQKVG